MKISVYNLKVVMVKFGENHHYLICKERMTPNTYTEVLTGRKIVIESPKVVESLSSFYPILAVRNFSTGKPLMLSKKEILEKCIEINIYKGRKKYEEDIKSLHERNKKINEAKERVECLSTKERIEETSKKLFPRGGSWGSNEFTKSPTSLIQHLRDENWLATRLQSMGLEDVPFLDILEYVATSPEFTKMRYAYELSIVKWQIEWMRSGGDGWLVPKGYGEDFVMMDENYDIAFRKGIVLTLTAINMNPDVIEEGIERNADLWRVDLMRSAYHNTYRYPAFCDINLSDIPEDSEHEEKWINLRMYEYYQEHKESVDRYGTPTPEMLITPEEALELREYLSTKHQEKKDYLEKLEESSKDRSRIDTIQTLSKTLNN